MTIMLTLIYEISTMRRACQDLYVISLQIITMTIL